MFSIPGGNTTGPCHVCAGAPDAPAEFSSGPVLFNLDEDPSESNNVARQHPGVLAKLLARLKVLALESVEPQQWDPPYQGENYYCKDCPKHPHGAGTGPGIPWGAWCKDNGEDREQARPALLGSWDAFQGPSRTRMRQSVHVLKTISADSHCRAPLRLPLPPSFAYFNIPGSVAAAPAPRVRAQDLGRPLRRLLRRRE